MSSSDWIALGAVAIAVVTWVTNRRAVHAEEKDRKESVELLRRQISGEGAATLVAEGLGHLSLARRGRSPTNEIRFALRNVGRATARDVSVAVIRWGDEPGSVGQAIADADVAPALLVGERHPVHLTIPTDEARRGDLDLTGYWEDENGTHERNLAWLNFADVG